MRTQTALALLIIAGGCKKVDRDDRRNDSNVVSPVAVSTSPGATADSLHAESLTCGVTAATPITDDGIGDLRPGKTVSDIKRLCLVSSDSPQLGTEGQTERILVVEIGGETIQATVVDDRIFRLSVTTPAFTTRDSLGVDTPLRKIARMRGAQFAPGEDGVYGFVAAHCGLSFRFSLPLRPPAGGQWNVSTIDKDHGDAVVDRVLVRKCRG